MTDLWSTLVPLIIGSAVLPIQLAITVLLLQSGAGLPGAVAWVGGMTVVRLAQGIVFGLVLGAAAAEAGGETGAGLIESALLLVVAILFLVMAGLAVADGLAVTARVITAAAAIMVFVFGVFIYDPNVFIKQIGLGLATAIFVDATIIRIVLVPATMELLGNANWWIPHWLDRILPDINDEATIEAELSGLLTKESTVV